MPVMCVASPLEMVKQPSVVELRPPFEQLVQVGRVGGVIVVKWRCHDVDLCRCQSRTQADVGCSVWAVRPAVGIVINWPVPPLSLWVQ